MATLIPALGSCVSRMTSGERRLAERLEAKLDDDYRLWYDVPMGPRNTIECPTARCSTKYWAPKKT